MGRNFLKLVGTRLGNDYRYSLYSIFIAGKNSILANQKILVLEANKNPTSYTSQQDYRNRVIFLNKNTQSLLESIDAWQHVTNERLGIVKRMHVIFSL